MSYRTKWYTRSDIARAARYAGMSDTAQARLVKLSGADTDGGAYGMNLERYTYAACDSNVECKLFRQWLERQVQGDMYARV